MAVLGSGSALALLAWFGVAPASAERAALVPLLLGMVFVGLPHGALDHLVPARLDAAWKRRPASMALYLAATLLHWGQGALDFLERFLGRRLRDPACDTDVPR